VLPTARRVLSGWGRLDPAECDVVRPGSAAEIRGLLADGPASPVIARGLGRSYGDSAVEPDGLVVSYARLNRILAFDPTAGVLVCEAGVSIAEIVETFLPRGFLPPVTPGTKHVTVGGAIAADIHGKNHHVDGTFSCFVDGFELVTADGRLVACSRESNPGLFWATVGGMGLTGFILSATIRLLAVETAYVESTVRRAGSLDEALEQFEADDNEAKYSVAWIDSLAKGRSLGRSVMIRGQHAPLAALTTSARREALRIAPRRSVGVPFHLPSSSLNRFTVAAFNALYYRLNRPKRTVQHYDKFFYPLDSISNWNRVYGKRGFIQYQALFPPRSSREGTIALLEVIAGAGAGSFLTVFKKTGPEGPGLLSFPRAGYTLALDIPNSGVRLQPLVRSMDRIVLRHGGRLYLAKDSMMDRETFDAMYPRAARFREVKRRVDPDDRFLSRQARRLGLTARG
jgi:FAD/FMN-containing dehydrogenase